MSKFVFLLASRLQKILTDLTMMTPSVRDTCWAQKGGDTQFPRHTPDIFPCVAINFRNVFNSAFCLQSVIPYALQRVASPKLERTLSASNLSTLWWRKVWRDACLGEPSAQRKNAFCNFLIPNSLDWNLLMWTSGATLFSMSCQSAMIRSPVQPLPEFRFLGRNFAPKWLWRLWSFVEIGLTEIKAPQGVTGPSNRVPNLPSHGDFRSASLSCMVPQ